MPARIIETNESPLNPIDVDGITVDLIENALKNAREEMDALVSRTALSPGIREQGDCFPMIANREGKMVVGQFGSFIHGFTEAYDEEIEEVEIEDTESDEDLEVIEEEEETTDEIFMVVEDMPRFEGCTDETCTQTKIMQFIARKTKYPPIAKENNITGRVFVSFVVDKSGKVTNVKILRGVDKYLDAEAVRVVTSLPKFKPGKQRGKSVKVQYNVPISFKLN